MCIFGRLVLNREALHRIQIPVGNKTSYQVVSQLRGRNPFLICQRRSQIVFCTRFPPACPTTVSAGLATAGTEGTAPRECHARPDGCRWSSHCVRCCWCATRLQRRLSASRGRSLPVCLRPRRPGRALSDQSALVLPLAPEDANARCVRAGAATVARGMRCGARADS